MPSEEKGESLYILDKDLALVAKETQKEEATLWHKRLEHLHMAGVKSLEGMAKGMAVQKQKEAICATCIKGKQYKMFNRHEPSARMMRRLEMVHLGTCGHSGHITSWGKEFCAIYG